MASWSRDDDFYNYQADVRNPSSADLVHLMVWRCWAQCSAQRPSHPRMQRNAFPSKIISELAVLCTNSVDTLSKVCAYHAKAQGMSICKKILWRSHKKTCQHCYCSSSQAISHELFAGRASLRNWCQIKALCSHRLLPWRRLLDQACWVDHQ